MPTTTTFEQRLSPRLHDLYGDRAAEALAAVQRSLAAHRDEPGSRLPEPRHWSENDTVLITYADQVREEGRAPLRSLRDFLADHRLHQAISSVHLLPFFPSSSDDGFSVVDYRRVDPDFGSWEDVTALGEDFELMFDFVLNHTSQHSAWIRDGLAGRKPFDRFFHDVEPNTDLSDVVRPRTSPLLTPFETMHGRRWLWTTFSDDQVDLDWSEPVVLAAMLDVLLFYVRQGARIVRLDAVAFLWKEVGTSCLHLPRTHAVVALLRDVIAEAAPGVWLLTETNVPQPENLQYFGQGDEAHLVYQFPLPPLLLDAMLQRDTTHLRRWLLHLPRPPGGATFLNFTASHDGIGVRPAEGLLPASRIADLVDAVRQRGGEVSQRRSADGTDAPYELNITWFDALAEPGADDLELHARRMLVSQAIMLALPGIPAVYFHSLCASTGDHAGRQRTGRARSLNRHKHTRTELDAHLSDDDRAAPRVFAGLRHLLTRRRSHPAFHPDAAHEVLDLAVPDVFALRRGGEDAGEIVVVANLSRQPHELAIPEARRLQDAVDLVGPGPTRWIGDRLRLDPYQVLWLALPEE